MPFLPYDLRDPSTGLFPESVPLGPEINDAIAAICPLYGDLEQWQRDALSNLPGVGGGAGARLALGRNLWDELCEPHGGLPPLPPAGPQVPTFPTNCATQGTVNYQVNVGVSIENPTWIPGQSFWNCPDGLGIPVGQPVWAQISGDTWGYQLTLQNASGTGTTTLNITQNTFGNVPERTVIDSISISYCPGCDLPPPPPPPPGVPQTVPPEPPRPQIPFEFSIPQLPGLPDLSFPITYSPTVNLDTPINLQPVFTFEPNVDLSPEFGFAPTFEFNFGGVSVGGGGYSEPRRDTAELADCDCPDPCPPVGDVDYTRIQTIVKNVVRTLNDLPGELSPAELGSEVTGEEVTLNLLPGALGVNFSIDLTNYTGGASLGTSEDTSVFYTGWYWFGRSAAQSSGDRQFFTSTNGFLPVPRNCRRFTAVMRDGAIITATAVNQPPIPPEE